jgi:hypothetical protein
MVTDYRRLKGMQRQGFITFVAGRERHWTGWQVKRCHVQPGPKLEHWYDTFVYRGEEYRLRYVDGCFHPFVFALKAQVRAFV